MTLWYLLYNLIGVPILYSIFRVGYYFNEKIRKGIDGRKNLFEDIATKRSTWNKEHEAESRKQEIKSTPDSLLHTSGSNHPALETCSPEKLKILWFHSSSLGEFEQGKPLIAALKKRYGEKVKIVVSFFSPSGYKHARYYPLADLVFYLPFDTPFHAKKLIRLLQPDVWILLKYDTWPNHIWAAAEAQIPIFLVSAALPRTSGRLYPLVKSLNREVYRHLKMVFAISQEDAQRLRQICSASTQIVEVGDTRYDQVYLRSQSVQDQKELIQRFSFEGRKLVAGSTWGNDERYLLRAFKILSSKYPDLRLILVPHEPSPRRLEAIALTLKKHGLDWIYASKLQRIQRSIPGAQEEDWEDGRMGEWKNVEMNPEALPKVIVVDQVGILANLYAVADITFVGGGFGTSIHNVMEPASMGKPVLFGPAIHKALEAIQLVERRGGMIVRNELELINLVSELLDDPALLRRTGEAARGLILENRGATDKILKYLEGYLTELLSDAVMNTHQD